ncbi:hypothetical protein K402DRAFT_395991 [Aulographum hederae CBS 113979]|uniref:Uncharacterized protein n=1 Tax=Aulographum hederae CBS 113979 TaxID=1176131 RepID=A0A6G1GSU2_9PEZI|nr:hypothetical protein K402DRAFT_395991 [Aulographum hederae CBS 113979]
MSEATFGAGNAAKSKAESATAANTALEEEIRRPGKKIDVLSDDEYYAMKEAQYEEAQLEAARNRIIGYRCDIIARVLPTKDGFINSNFGTLEPNVPPNCSNADLADLLARVLQGWCMQYQWEPAYVSNLMRSTLDRALEKSNVAESEVREQTVSFVSCSLGYL